MSVSAKITPFLWFTAPQALHAAEFYVQTFSNSPSASSSPPSEITATTKYPSAQPDDPDDTSKFSDPGSILTVNFTLAGHPFVALNGNKEGTEMPWKFNEATSFQISCDTQEEIDHFWKAITANGGIESACGWCKDRWGVSWQVTPSVLVKLMSDADPAAKERVTTRMYTMKKMDLAALEAAAKGE